MILLNCSEKLHEIEKVPTPPPPRSANARILYPFLNLGQISGSRVSSLHHNVRSPRSLFLCFSSFVISRRCLASDIYRSLRDILRPLNLRSHHQMTFVCEHGLHTLYIHVLKKNKTIHKTMKNQVCIPIGCNDRIPILGGLPFLQKLMQLIVYIAYQPRFLWNG